MQQQINFSEFSWQAWGFFITYILAYLTIWFVIFGYQMLKKYLPQSKIVHKIDSTKAWRRAKIAVVTTPVKLYLLHLYVKYFYKNLPLNLREKYFNLVYYALNLRVKLFNDSTIVFIFLGFLIGWGIYTGNSKQIIVGFVFLILPIFIVHDNWVRLGKIYDIRIEQIIPDEHCPGAIYIVSDGVKHHVLNFDDAKKILALPNNGMFATLKVRGYCVDIRHNQKIYSRAKIFEIVV